MAQETVYIKLKKKLQTSENDVFLSDCASVLCRDEHIQAKVRALKIFHFSKTTQDKEVIDVMKIIQLIEGVSPSIQVDSIGETDLLIEKVKLQKRKGFTQWIKVLFVTFICFFGTAFTIMSFHNDIGINQMFGKFYEVIMNEPSTGYGILEISYSIGLSIGIIMFFNHFGNKRITNDPTPVEVEMRVYDDDVRTTVIDVLSREDKTIDV